MSVTIKAWLTATTEQFTQADISSARLDALILLEHVLKRPRTFLLAHDDELIDSTQHKKLRLLVANRCKRIPIAYLVGAKEFYGRPFYVNETTLIPRPETEKGIELIKKYATPNGRLLDVGTGTGCIGITALLEIPSLTVVVSDTEQAALDIAHKNSTALGAKPIRRIKSNLLDHWIGHAKPKKFDLIVANLPYVDHSWNVSAETRYEPSSALYADDQGLALIYKLLDQSQKLMKDTGALLLESDPRQHEAIATYATSCRLQCAETIEFWQVFRA